MKNKTLVKQSVQHNRKLEYIGKRVHEDRVNRGDIGIACGECKTGYCCQGNKNVFVSTDESIVIKDRITNEHRENAKVAINMRELTGRYRCPFYIDNRCSIYDVRPVVCSSYFVIAENEEGCKHAKDKVSFLSSLELIYGVMDNVTWGRYATDAQKEYDILDLFKG